MSEPTNPEDLRAELSRVRAELDELRSRLKEPEEIIRALRRGEVDAVVVTDTQGEKIYSLRSADVLYRHMVEEMQEGAVAIDPSGIIVYANGYFARLMKAERERLTGTSVLSFVPEESRPFFDAPADPDHADTRRLEFVLRASDGAAVPVHATMNRIDLEDGMLFCLIVTDLTMERRREQLLMESRRKDEFLAMLAHELRNPIAPIRNAAQVIQLSGTKEPRVVWAREVIDRQAKQLSRLVDDLLDISRITRGKIRLEMQPVDLQIAVARGIETVQPMIEARRHKLSVDMPHALLRANGDAARLSQVVANILHNAAKFTPEQGEIWVGLEARGNDALITIRDNGIGIVPEILPRIFELFTQADATIERAQGGLGLGLALVRTLVELHGGRVEAVSEGLGRGSTFTVTLPLLQSSSELEGSGVDHGTPPARRKQRVLVVDDNFDAAESLMFLLVDLGHDARMVTDGSQVLAAVREFRPRVVLLDISLPDVSGFEVAQELRSNPELGPLCLVALTGYGQEDYRRRSQEVGFDHHWIKPVNLAMLEGLLSSLDSEEARRR
jgi:PAS domain S-box-containing protein